MTADTILSTDMDLKPPPPLAPAGQTPMGGAGDDGPTVALLARLTEATEWNDLVRRHETDAWGYMRRKLQATAGPFKDFKQGLFDKAKEQLFADLSQSIMPPGAIEKHRETFEILMMPGDFADLAFNLLPGGDPKHRLEMCKMILTGAVALTLFDVEALPALQRGNAWQKRVMDLSTRLGLDLLAKIADRGVPSEKRKAFVVRRLRKHLREYLTITRHDSGVRAEITPFVLVRLEAAVAATLRFLNRIP